MEHLFLVTRGSTGFSILVLSAIPFTAIFKAKQDLYRKLSDLGLDAPYIMSEEDWTAQKIEFDEDGIAQKFGWFLK